MTNFTETDASDVTSTVYLTTSVESEVADGIDLYLPPVLFVNGLVCNTFVILVMRAPYFAKVSTSLYMSFNALIDNVSLAMVLPAHWLHVNFPSSIYRGSHSDFICKALNFLGWGTSDLGIILTSAMTLERAIAIKFPLHSVSYCTVKKARYIIGCLIVLILLKDGIFLVSSAMAPLQEETQLCELDNSDPNIRNYSENVLPVIHNVFLFVSFIIIIISNIVILKSVRSSEGFPPYPSTVRASGQQGIQASGEQRSRVSGDGEQEAERVIFRTRASTRGKQLTIMLLSDSLTIVICTLPFSVVTSIDFRPTDTGTRHLAFSISLYLLYVNRCANFFLYCISGERFRHGLKTLCLCKSIRSRNNIDTSTFVQNMQQQNIARNRSAASAYQGSEYQQRSFALPS